MPNVALFDVQGKRAGEAEISDRIFGIEPNAYVIHEAVRVELANRRRGTHDTKTRGEVSGGGKKPWRQKGTGRARQGSTRSPIWRHGGVVWGPHPHSYELGMNRKIKRLALISALSDRASEGALNIIEDIKIDAPSTKTLANILKAMEAKGKVLLIIGSPDVAIRASAQNIPGLTLRVAPTVSVYDIMNQDSLVVTRSAASRLEEVFGK